MIITDKMSVFDKKYYFERCKPYEKSDDIWEICDSPEDHGLEGKGARKFSNELSGCSSIYNCSFPSSSHEILEKRLLNQFSSDTVIRVKSRLKKCSPEENNTVVFPVERDGENLYFRESAFVKVKERENDPIDSDCTVRISGKRYKGTLKFSLDPKIDNAIFTTLKCLDSETGNFQKDVPLGGKTGIINTLGQACKCFWPEWKSFKGGARHEDNRQHSTANLMDLCRKKVRNTSAKVVKHDQKQAAKRSSPNNKVRSTQTSTSAMTRKNPKGKRSKQKDISFNGRTRMYKSFSRSVPNSRKSSPVNARGVICPNNSQQIEGQSSTDCTEYQLPPIKNDSQQTTKFSPCVSKEPSQNIVRNTSPEIADSKLQTKSSEIGRQGNECKTPIVTFPTGEKISIICFQNCKKKKKKKAKENFVRPSKVKKKNISVTKRRKNICCKKAREKSLKSLKGSKKSLKGIYSKTSVSPEEKRKKTSCCKLSTSSIPNSTNPLERKSSIEKTVINGKSSIPSAEQNNLEKPNFETLQLNKMPHHGVELEEIKNDKSFREAKTEKQSSLQDSTPINGIGKERKKKKCSKCCWKKYSKIEKVYVMDVERIPALRKSISLDDTENLQQRNIATKSSSLQDLRPAIKSKGRFQENSDTEALKCSDNIDIDKGLRSKKESKKCNAKNILVRTLSKPPSFKCLIDRSACLKKRKESVKYNGDNLMRTPVNNVRKKDISPNVRTKPIEISIDALAEKLDRSRNSYEKSGRMVNKTTLTDPIIFDEGRKVVARTRDAEVLTFPDGQNEPVYPEVAKRISPSEAGLQNRELLSKPTCVTRNLENDNGSNTTGRFKTRIPPLNEDIKATSVTSGLGKLRSKTPSGSPSYTTPKMKLSQNSYTPERDNLRFSNKTTQAFYRSPTPFPSYGSLKVISGDSNDKSSSPKGHSFKTNNPQEISRTEHLNGPKINHSPGESLKINGGSYNKSSSPKRLNFKTSSQEDISHTEMPIIQKNNYNLDGSLTINGDSYKKNPSPKLHSYNASEAEDIPLAENLNGLKYNYSTIPVAEKKVFGKEFKIERECTCCPFSNAENFECDEQEGKREYHENYKRKECGCSFSIHGRSSDSPLGNTSSDMLDNEVRRGEDFEKEFEKYVLRQLSPQFSCKRSLNQSLQKKTSPQGSDCRKDNRRSLSSNYSRYGSSVAKEVLRKTCVPSCRAKCWESVHGNNNTVVRRRKGSSTLDSIKNQNVNIRSYSSYTDSTSSSSSEATCCRCRKSRKYSTDYSSRSSNRSSKRRRSRRRSSKRRSSDNNRKGSINFTKKYSPNYSGDKRKSSRRGNSESSYVENTESSERLPSTSEADSEFQSYVAKKKCRKKCCNRKSRKKSNSTKNRSVSGSSTRKGKQGRKYRCCSNNKKAPKKSCSGEVNEQKRRRRKKRSCCSTNKENSRRRSNSRSLSIDRFVYCQQSALPFGETVLNVNRGIIRHQGKRSNNQLKRNVEYPCTYERENIKTERFNSKIMKSTSDFHHWKGEGSPRENRKSHYGIDNFRVKGNSSNIRENEKSGFYYPYSPIFNYNEEPPQFNALKTLPNARKKISQERPLKIKFLREKSKMLYKNARSCSKLSFKKKKCNKITKNKDEDLTSGSNSNLSFTEEEDKYINHHHKKNPNWENKTFSDESNEYNYFAKVKDQNDWYQEKSNETIKKRSVFQRFFGKNKQKRGDLMIVTDYKNFRVPSSDALFMGGVVDFHKKEIDRISKNPDGSRTTRAIWAAQERKSRKKNKEFPNNKMAKMDIRTFGKMDLLGQNRSNQLMDINKVNRQKKSPDKQKGRLQNRDKSLYTISEIEKIVGVHRLLMLGNKLGQNGTQICAQEERVTKNKRKRRRKKSRKKAEKEKGEKQSVTNRGPASSLRKAPTRRSEIIRLPKPSLKQSPNRSYCCQAGQTNVKEIGNIPQYMERHIIRPQTFPWAKSPYCDSNTCGGSRAENKVFGSYEQFINPTVNTALIEIKPHMNSSSAIRRVNGAEDRLAHQQVQIGMPSENKPQTDNKKRKGVSEGKSYLTRMLNFAKRLYAKNRPGETKELPLEELKIPSYSSIVKQQQSAVVNVNYTKPLNSLTYASDKLRCSTGYVSDIDIFSYDWEFTTSEPYYSELSSISCPSSSTLSYVFETET